MGLDGDVPDHSTFSKNRRGRFRESDLLRKLFETVVARCMKEGIVGGEAFAVDASLIVADAYRRRGVAKVEELDPTSSRAVAEYLSVLDDAAFGGATAVEPKSISPTDPAGRNTAAADTPAFYAYSDNYLVDLKNAVIMDVEATTAIRQAEVGAARTMIDRTAEQFDVTPSRLVADAGYGSAEMVGWLVDERGIEPHVKLMDKSERADGTLSRSDFVFDAENDLYTCPGGKDLKKYHRPFSKPRDGLTKDGTLLYFARKQDCDACALKAKCCPNTPARKIARSGPWISSDPETASVWRDWMVEKDGFEPEIPFSVLPSTQSETPVPPKIHFETNSLRTLRKTHLGVSSVPSFRNPLSKSRKCRMKLGCPDDNNGVISIT